MAKYLSKFNMLSIISFEQIILAILQGFRLVDALPNPSPLMGSNWGNPRRYVHMQTSSNVNNFYIEILNGHLRKTTLRSSYSKERLAILGVKSNRYLCIDALGNPFSSTVCHKEDGLFNHKLLENHRDVYYSCRTGILLNVEGIKQVFTVGQNLPQTSLFPSEKNTGRIIYRETPQSPYADLWNDAHSVFDCAVYGEVPMKIMLKAEIMLRLFFIEKRQLS
uniref:Fibroblast growth factor 23 n=1 Tax=Oncorhynchus kisutch TaxID=8019 RepID=A0A8C7D2I8_ONCKI